ncbi:MAG TPA: STAS domain-containing protein [Bryobacteraceae bacterium]|nr:STAS domain-containing protein [Bryobacteraceae bacterium]
MPAEPSVAIEIAPPGDVCVLRLRGRFTAGPDPDYVLGKLDKAKVRSFPKVLVDLSELSSIGSMGIGFLVGLYTSVMKSPEGRFVMAGATARVREVLALTRLDTVIPQAVDVAAGLAALRAKSAGTGS